MATRCFRGLLSSLGVTLAILFMGCTSHDGLVDSQSGSVEEASSSALASCEEAVIEGDLTIRSLEDVAAYQHVTRVTGRLRFEEFETATISGLDCLTSVGRLDFRENQGTSRITGFPRLEQIDSRMYISENEELTRIDGFPRLKTIGENIYLEDHPAGVTIDGFDSLYSIGGNVSIEGDEYTILGFNSLERIDGRFMVGGCDSFAIHGMNDLSTIGGKLEFEAINELDLSGLNDLERVLGDVVFSNTEWINTSGLSDLSVIEGTLYFIESENEGEPFAGFTDLEHIAGDLWIEGGAGRLVGFPELESIGGDIRIQDADIEYVGGFDDLEVISGSLIVEGMNPEAFEGFNELEEIGGSLDLLAIETGRVSGFNELERVGGQILLSELHADEFSGFDDLERLDGNLIIEVSSLGEIDAFDDLEHIEGDFVVHSAPGFDNLSAFGDLRSVGNNLEISYNPLLYRIELSSLESLGGSILIEFNRILPDCVGWQLYHQLVANGYPGDGMIWENKDDDDVACNGSDD